MNSIHLINRAKVKNGVSVAKFFELAASVAEAVRLLMKIPVDGDVVVNVTHAKHARVLGFLRTVHIRFPSHHHLSSSVLLSQ
jgi:hypothetical protein